MHQIFQQVIRLHDETKPACPLDQPVQTRRCWEVTEHAPTGDVLVGEQSLGKRENFCNLIQKVHLDLDAPGRIHLIAKKQSSCATYLATGL